MNEETWLNSGRGKVWVRKLDRKGDMVDELVHPGRTFKISTEDRQSNQERAASDRLDNFKNGVLVPVRDTMRILDGTEDAADIASNPNLLAESDMANLLNAHFKTFESKVNAITNRVTLEKLLAVAEESDAKVSKINCLKSRIGELNEVGVAEREVVATANPHLDDPEDPLKSGRESPFMKAQAL